MGESKEDSRSVEAGQMSLSIDSASGRLQFEFRGKEIAQTVQAPKFKLAGEAAVIKAIQTEGDGLLAILEGVNVKGTWKLTPAADAIESVIEIDETWGDKAVDIEIPFPLSAAIELPVDQRYSARIDSSCTPGRDGGVSLSTMRCHIAAVDTGGAALAFIGLGKYKRSFPGTYGGSWRQGAWKDEKCLWLTLQTLNGSKFQISCRPDLDGVIDHYCLVLRENLGVLTLAEDSSVPGWLDEIRVFAIFEMFRSDGEILNTFADVTSFCHDLQKLGITGGVVVRLVGFHGRFDSHYPYFDPADELGGPGGMRELAEAVHAGGNRFSTHLNLWGLDPYLEDFEEIEHLALPYDRAYERIPTGQIGPYEGWPGVYPAVPTGFDSGRLEIDPIEADQSHIIFKTCDIPEQMEAFLTVGGVRSFEAGVIRAEVNDRQVKSPGGMFERTDTVRFRFRFRFVPGVNRVRLDFVGALPDTSELTYRINGSVTGGKVWSYPFIRGDIRNPGWIEVTRNNLVRICREYDVDIPHVDIINIWRDEDRPIFEMMREELPDRIFSCENSAELGYNIFRLTLTGWKCVPTQEEAGYKVSDFSTRIHQRYTRLWSVGYAYVPFGGPGCHSSQLEALEGEKLEAAERLVRECPRWGVHPGVRLNYRDHGLDRRAREIILAACER